MTIEAFEAWVGKGLHLERIPTGAPFAGDYRSIVMQTRWDAWQAATNAAQAEIDKLQAQLVRQQASYEAEIKVEIDAALERAAEACEEMAWGVGYRGWNQAVNWCAKAIRALKDKS